jgi:hypothetical protein
MTDISPAKRPRKRLSGRRAPKTPEEAAQYASWTVHKMAQGRMTVEEGKVIVALLREYSRLYELAALLKRIADLETRLKLHA